MSGAVGTLQKPQLRGLINRQIGRNLIVGIILAISGGIAFKVLVNDRHKRKHAEFFRYCLFVMQSKFNHSEKEREQFSCGNIIKC